MKGSDIKIVNKDNPKFPISVVLISLNEQVNIVRALKSVSWAQDVVVYDSGSSDLTVDIAKKMGANVIEGTWLGFGKTKKTATSHAKFDWVLSLDCDEEVTKELAQEICDKLPNLNPQSAYSVPRLSCYLNRWIRWGGWYPDRQLRLFNKKHSGWNESTIHEKIEAKDYQKLASNLNHYVFKNIEHQIQTNNRYSSLQAEKMHAEGKKFSWFHFFTKPWVKFVENYFWKLGFLDGWVGYVIAVNSAHSVFLKWSKLREIKLRQDSVAKN